jgi:hypothetical protein
MKGLAVNGDFYIGLKTECTWLDGATCHADITSWTVPNFGENYAANWWTNQAA